jgi:hypothetical protein
MNVGLVLPWIVSNPVVVNDAPAWFNVLVLGDDAVDVWDSRP